MTTFASISDVYSTNRAPLPIGRQRLPWRLTPKQVTGTINGIPSTWGRLVATDGIMCAIWHTGTQRFVFGHLQWFVPDAPSHMAWLRKEQRGTSAPSPNNGLITEYLA